MDANDEKVIELCKSVLKKYRDNIEYVDSPTLGDAAKMAIPNVWVDGYCPKRTVVNSIEELTGKGDDK